MNRMLLLLVAASLNAPPNSARAQASPTVWKASELWRVDGSEAGEPFGDVRDVVVAKSGVLWMLDYKDQHIRRYDTNGKPLATVGRKGSGPGEMRDANGLVIARDGSVWLNDPANARLTVFDAQGVFARQHVMNIPGFGWRWEAWVDQRTGDVMDAAFIRRPGAQVTWEWRRVDATGTVRDTVAKPSCSSGDSPPTDTYRAKSKTSGRAGAYPFSSGGGNAPDGNGAMWCADAGSQRVALVRLGTGDTLARTTLVLPRIPVSKLERDSAIHRIVTSLKNFETNDFDPSKVLTSKASIALLSVDDDGRLWVRHTQPFNERTTTFDVHDRAGKHLGRVKIPHQLTGLPPRARGNELWLSVLDADDVVHLVKYRLGR